MSYENVTESLYLIDLNQELTGFRKFISAWLYRGKNITFLVDPGPSYSIDHLIDVLEKIPIKALDYILLTHIHIDHAGGAGKLLSKFPDATIICHPKGIGHMIDPEKLWQGSLKVLGDIARAYGPVIPVDKNKIRFQDSISTEEGEISVLQTPGHAVHHLCYNFGDWLFAGEVAGVRHQAKDHIYARPATPPVFKLEISLESLDKVIAIEPRNLCLGHYGYVEHPKEFLKRARSQLIQWVNTVREELKGGETAVVERSIESLMKSDILLSEFSNLDSDIKQREEYFIFNSIKGILASLLPKPAKK